MVDLNIGFSLILGKNFTKNEFIEMVAHSFALSNTHIKVIYNYEELCDSPLKEEDKVLILLSEVGGRFKMLANFSLCKGLKYDSIECIVKNICIYSKTECLLPDESSRCDIDMILFLPDGSQKNVYVNSEVMDRDEYVIESYK